MVQSRSCAHRRKRQLWCRRPACTGRLTARPGGVMEFVDPRKTPFVPVRSRGELPHLHKPGGVYFVTFRLADAVLPGRPRHPNLTASDIGPSEMMEDYDPPLTLGSCALRDARVAKIVQDAILFFEGRRYYL